jgi:Predicted membrane protein
MCVTGVCIIGIGVGFMRYADFGIDPYMCFMNGLHLAIFKKLNFVFGTTFAVSSLLLILIVLVFDRSKIGLGTIAAIALTGYVSDFGVFLCNLILIEGTALFILRIGMMVFGILLVAVGSGMYFNTHVGVSPYDGIGLIITQKIGNQNMYRWVRIATDLICVGIGFLLGNMPGVGTVIMALFTGPLFAFFRNKILVWGKRLKIITW